MGNQAGDRQEEYSADSLFDVYIPFDRRAALQSQSELPSRTSGSVLFADMSGFTKLTEALISELGPGRGAEELSKRVDSVLGCVIDEVHRYGGSIISFSGDAVTGWFDHDDGRSAVAAALASQNCRHTHGTDPEHPAVKMIVTAGLARRFLVGHPRIQRLEVVAGGIVDRVAAAEHLAAPGDVLVGSEILGRVQAEVDILNWRQAPVTSESFAVISGDPATVSSPVENPTLSPLDRDIARDWLLPAVLQRLDRGEGEFLSEMRQAVSLFLQFTGIQYDLDNDAEEKLDSYIRWVQTTLARYEATLLELILGDKGSYLFASFGAPVSHEDDALRALRAAEALRNVPAELSFIQDVAIGVAQGKMFAGTYGGPTRRTYGLLGRGANVAARLMERAGTGQILVTAELAESTRYEYAFRELDGPPPAPPAPPEAYVITGRKLSHRVLTPKSTVDTRLVGRTDERRTLAQSLESLLDGQSGLALIDGPAGIGKSRLLLDLTEQSDGLGVTTLVGAGNSMEQNTPLFAWRPVFQQLLGIHEDTAEDAIRSALQERLADSPALWDLLPLVNPVLPVNLPETEATMRISPAARGEATVEIMLRCMARPLGTLSATVLIMDDVQWLDSASWSLVDAARRNLGSLLIVLARRITEEDEWADLLIKTPDSLADLLASQRDRIIHLEPLSGADVRELIAEHLGIHTVPDSLFEVIVERSEGNPFFVQELIESFLQRNLIAVEGDVCQITGTVDELTTEVPERIEKLLTSRLDQLPMDQQTTLVVASVLGRQFTIDELVQVSTGDADRATIGSRLDSLVRLGLLVEEDDPLGGFRFRHGLTHEAAAELLPLTRRQGIHARAAEWIEEHYASTLTDFYPALAQHWDAAGSTGKALQYLDAAAEEAALSSAYDEAITFYSRALELAGADGSIAPDKIARWHLRLGEAYVNRQREDATEGQANLEAGLRKLNKTPPRNRVVEVIGLVGQLLLQIWNRLLRRHLHVSKKAQTLREASRAYERLVELYYISGKTIRSLYAALRALNLADAAGPSPEWTRAMASVGAMIGFIPLRRLAEWYLQQALDSIDANEPAADAWATHAAGFYYTGLGDWERAEERLVRVADRAQEIRDSRRLEDVLTTHTMKAYFEGDLARSLELGDRLCEQAEQRASDRPMAYCLGTRAYPAIEVEDLELTTKNLTRLAEIQEHPTFPDQALIDDRYGLQAIVALRQGDAGRALELADEVLGRVSGAPTNFAAFAAYGAPAEVYLTVWRETGHADPELRRKARAALKALKRYARIFPVGRPRLLRWRGVYEHLEGKQRKAIASMEAARQEARRLRMELEEALTDQELRRLPTNSQV